jgi:hypothetical protein
MRCHFTSIRHIKQRSPNSKESIVYNGTGATTKKPTTIKKEAQKDFVQKKTQRVVV